MTLIDAVKRGYRIRHRNWPPYHYAQLKQGREGRSELWRFAPHADATCLELRVDEISADRGWSLIEFRHQFA